MKLLIPPPVVGLTCALLAWGLARLQPIGDIHLPGQRAVAIALIAAGLLVDATAILAFLRARTTITPLSPHKTNDLVVDGWYRFSRNPMYVGMLSVLTGWVLWLGQPLGLATLAVFVLWINAFQILPEEHALKEKFGERYLAYCARVRRWL